MLTFLEVANGRWHKRVLQIFTIIVLAHWVEHLLQGIEVFLLNWPRAQAGGALGLLYPWLVTSEWLHYAYAVVMLLGLLAFRTGFVGHARSWWNLALIIQLWHHFEHFLLLVQATLSQNFFGAAVPTSIVQLVVPRVELHLFYNVGVFVPMVVAIWHHLHPTAAEEKLATCDCRPSPREVSSARMLVGS